MRRIITEKSMIWCCYVYKHNPPEQPMWAVAATRTRESVRHELCDTILRHGFIPLGHTRDNVPATMRYRLEEMARPEELTEAMICLNMGKVWFSEGQQGYEAVGLMGHARVPKNPV